MELLKVVNRAIRVDEMTRLRSYIAWLEWVPDTDLRRALVAANINVMRRNAQVVYLFALGFSLASWQVEDIGDETGYVRSLKMHEMRNSSWLSSDGAVITAIAYGDVLPVVHLLNNDDFLLLCLPSYRSLEEIDSAARNTSSIADFLSSLTTDEGCFITVTDDVCFKLLSFDQHFEIYFA